MDDGLSSGFQAPALSPQSLLVLLVGVLGLFTACQSGVKVAEMGESVTTGGMEVTVEDYEIRRLQLVEGNRTFEYPDPVLSIRVKFKNVGKDGFRYTPTHNAQKMTEATTPLLYSDPGKGKTLPPKDKTPVNGVVLEKGQLAGQIEKSKVVKPGESITDVMLFEVPGDKKANFIFSVPPQMHRGSKPVLFRIPYEYQEPKGRKTYGLGDTASFDGVKFTVDDVQTTYVELEDTTGGKAYSSKPLLKVSYVIENTTEEKIKYTPGHNAVSGQRGAELKSGDEILGRVKFSGNTNVVGQLSEETTIKPGSKIEDFSIFERPSEDTKAMSFEYPATRFERGGLVEFNLPYEYEKPEKPKPLQKKEKDEDD